jgi:Tol biopolymer transport system component
VEPRRRFGWLKSGRFLRLLSAVIAGAVLVALLYNAIMVDRIPPTYSMRVSNSSASGPVPARNSVDVDFSETVRHDTAEQAFSVSPNVSGSFHWQGLEMIFTPASKLPLSTKFHVHMAAGVQDLVGNAQGGTGDIDFTTVGAPAVTSVSPARAAQSVGVDAPILITFDRLMDTQKVIAGLQVAPDFTYQASWNGAVLSIVPTRPLQYGTAYTIKVGDPAVDTDGTKLTAYVTNFTTVDMGLRVAALIPSPGVAGVSIRSQIAVIFDGPIDATSISNAIKLTPPVSGSTSAMTLPDDHKPSAGSTAAPAGSGASVLVFTPDNPFPPHTTYSVTMSSTIKRTDGQVASAQAWSFTTGEAPVNALNQIAFISDRGGVNNVWLMNPDGSNQREVTAELVSISGFDVSGDGTTMVYGAGGVVKKMSIGGDNLQTLTSSGNYEYAPVITPDGTGVVVGRRDGQGADLGYWRYTLAGGSGTTQVAPDGAPDLGSSTLGGDGLTDQPGTPSWSGRAAFSTDGSAMLIVRGSDNVVELVDPKGVAKPQKLDLVAASRPVWVQLDSAFYVSATEDSGATWWYYKVTTAGVITRIGSSTSDIAASGRAVALLVESADGSVHVAYVMQAGDSPTLLATDPSFTEMSPSFSPSGATIVFGRVGSQSLGVSAGIWTVKPDGTGLTNLSTDGGYPRWLP